MKVGIIIADDIYNTFHVTLANYACIYVMYKHMHTTHVKKI